MGQESRAAKILPIEWKNVVRNVRTDISDGSSPLHSAKSFQANPFPAELGLAIFIENIVSWCDAEFMHDSIADDRTELVSSQSPPATLIAKLDVSGITICPPLIVSGRRKASSVPLIIKQAPATQRRRTIKEQFLSVYDAAAKDHVWRQQQEKFRSFWANRVLATTSAPLSEDECDVIIRILDAHAKGNTKDSESVARAMVPQNVWRRIFNEFRANQKLAALTSRIFETDNLDQKASDGAVNKSGYSQKWICASNGLNPVLPPRAENRSGLNPSVH